MSLLLLITIAVFVVGLLAVLFWIVYHVRVFCLHKTNVAQPQTHINPHVNPVGSQLAPNVKVFSFQELEKATKKFASDSVIGKGLFGFVYRGALGVDYPDIAVKRAQDSRSSISTKEQYIAELSILSLTNHINVVKLLGYCEENGERILVFNYALNRTLHHWLHDAQNNQFDSWWTRNAIALSVAKGIHYLHTFERYPIVHRDIKSDNILFDSQWNAIIADFGLATMDTDREDDYAGTFGYIDPIPARNGAITPKRDVYSFGIVLLEILTGKKARYENGLRDYVEDQMQEGIDIGVQIDNRVGIPLENERGAVEKMFTIALSCVKLENGEERPQMHKVIADLQDVSRLLLGQQV